MQLALLVALALAAKPAAQPDPDCTLQLVKICKPRPVAKKTQVKAVVKTVVKSAPCCQAPTQTQSQTVNVYVGQGQAQVQQQGQVITYGTPVVNQHPGFALGVRGALGMNSCERHPFGLLGLRVLAPGHWLGAEANTQFYWGHSLSLLVYPIPHFWHLDVGAIWFYHRGFATQDVDRRWDVLVGTGLEFPLLPHLALTADIRTTMVNPFDLNRLSYPDTKGRHLNAGNAVGNSLLRTQAMIGLMLHSW